MSAFHKLMKKCMQANRAKHTRIASPHEGLALIQEEVNELRKDVEKRQEKSDPLRFLNELVEIAAMCELFAEDIVCEQQRD